VFLASAGVESIQDQEHDTNHTELRTRQILLKNERLETQLAILRGEHVPAVEVERWGAELGAAIRKVVSQIHLIAPSVVGMSVAAAEARLKDLEDELLQQLHVLPQQLAQFTDGK
jgi:hypothetical protein